MRDCLVLGSGRSGTSMVAGALAGAGYRLGGRLHPARASNPRGFFEAAEINAINEALLAPMLAGEPRLADGQRWLGVPREGASPELTAALAERVRAAVAERPFCFKDPRFAFTLPAWRPHLGDAAFVCVFRDPALTATSIVAECASAAYLDGVEVDLAHALRLWIATHRAILESEARSGEWIFVHYDQMLAPEGRARLARFLGCELDGSFPDAHLRRDEPRVEVPAEASALYAELCERAGFAPREAAPRRRAEEEPEVSVVALVDGEGPEAAAALVEDVRAQRGVRAELVLVDRGFEGGLAVEGATVVHEPSWSRGDAWLAGLAAARAPLVAWLAPGCRSLPSRLAHAREALRREPRAALSVADGALTDAEGAFVERASPAAMGEAPGPYWESGVVLRREALATIRRTAFHPVELELYQRLRAEGRVTAVAEPGYAVELARHEERFAESRRDAYLVGAAREAAGAREAEPERAPELSISLCTFDRREVLRECLGALARQTAAGGAFELVLVDDSRDGTERLLADLELPFPARILRGPGRGLAAARNASVAAARGRLLLFVNDDTIAFPDLVERHLDAHARLAPDEPLAVLGGFEQPREHLANALARHLEESNRVFRYAEMRPGERYDGFRFWTCNLSVPAALVRRAGGFDESFRGYGCEDTDLGLRLEELGLEVLYEPRARALHRHRMDFDYLRRRQRTVGRAYVRLARKHPRVLARWKNEERTALGCREQLEGAKVRLEPLEEAAAQLAALDLGALEELDGAYRAAAESAYAKLGELLDELEPLWWAEGYLDGMREHRIAGFDELVAGGVEPWPIDCARERRLLAWPRWDDPRSLERAMELAAPVAGGFAALVLRLDPDATPRREEALAALEGAYARTFPDGAELEVVLEEARLGRADLFRLGRSVDALLALGGEPREALRGIVAERLGSPEEVRAWRARFEAPPGAAPERDVEAERAPLLSVVVPTRDRERELLGLLRELARQDLDPARFEVIVVDDGSEAPVAEALGARRWPFRLTLLRQDPAGPAAARNLGVSHARGELVVFFNDDAVPARDNLRRHLESQRHARERHAVVGTFRLSPERVRDSFAAHVESSAALFAQPLMKPGVLYHGLSLCTGNASIHRSVLAELGGFDEGFPWPGGEDSELGLRLERQLGCRVRFDPSIECGHDHELDVRAFARRQRELGWSAGRIQELHGDVGLLGEEPWPGSEELWGAIEREARDCAGELEQLVEDAHALCLREREAGRGPQALEDLRPVFDQIRDLEFRRGLLCARRGLPLDGSAPARVETAASVAVAAEERARAGELVAAGAARSGSSGVAVLGAEPEAAAVASARPSAPEPATETVDELARAAGRIEGELEATDLRLFIEAGREANAGTIVEIGRDRGRTAVALALGTMVGAGLPVFAFDAEDELAGSRLPRLGPIGRSRFQRALHRTGATEVVRVVQLPGALVAASWTRPIALLCRDGARPDLDLARWAPHLRRGAGVLVESAGALESPATIAPGASLVPVRSGERWTLLRWMRD